MGVTIFLSFYSFFLFELEYLFLFSQSLYIVMWISYFVVAVFIETLQKESFVGRGKEQEL